MGLSINVGMLADLLEGDPEGAEWLQEGLDAANRVLKEYRLPSHEEPKSLPVLHNRCSASGYPYSFLHYLRRVYAHRKADPSWIAEPFPPDAKASEDRLVRVEYGREESHLINHSDAEGFYLPVDFKEVLYDHDEKVPGALIGSSFRLLEELVFVAPALGISLNGNELSDQEAMEIERAIDAEEDLHIEKLVWLSLFEAARLSIEHRTAIVFG